MMLWKIMVLLGTLLLTACSRSPQSSIPQAWLQPGTQVQLPAPTLSQPINQQQLLSATVNGKTQSLLVLLSADGERLALVGMSPMGIRLFTLNYDKQGIHTQQLVVIDKLPPASQVLADIMLSYWPIKAWQPLLPTGWQLEDQGDLRRLTDQKGKLISEIRYQTQAGQRNPIAIRQQAFGYHIDIQNLGSNG